MLHGDFKKCLCSMSLSLIYQSNVEANSYQMSCINHNNKQDADIIFATFIRSRL